MQTSDGIFVRVSGPVDGQPVLLLHGVPQTGEMWDRLAARLAAAGRRVLVPDLPGLGRSRPLTSYEIVNVVAALRTMLDGLDISGPLDVVGHDWGGSIAIGVSSAVRVRRLGVVSAPYKKVGLIRAYHIPLFQLPVLPEVLLRVVNVARWAYWRAWKGPTPPDPARVAADAAAYTDAAHIKAMLGYYRGARKIRRVGDGPRAEQLLVLWGAADNVLSMRLGESVVKSLQHRLPSPDAARLVAIPGVGHFPLEEAPEVAGQTIEDFLS